MFSPKYNKYILLSFFFLLHLVISSYKSCNNTSANNKRIVRLIGNIDSSNSGTVGLLAVNRYSSYFAVASGSNGKIVTTTNAGINWTSQNSGVTDSLISISCLSSDTIVVAGSRGLIIRSTNKGVNWNTVFVDTTKKLKYILFDKKMNGISVGENGVVLKSTNSGLNWNLDTLNDGVNNLPILKINNVSMYGDSTAWVCCDSGKIFYTNNFAATWTLQTSGVNVRLNSISFCNSQRGTCVGSNSTMLETFNGGLNWVIDTVPNPGKELLSVSRSDRYTVFISGIGYVFRELENHKTVIFNNPFYLCPSISVDNNYLIAFVTSSNELIYSVSTDECPCSRCSHQLTIVPVIDGSGCEWEVSGRFNTNNPYKDVLRVIIGGGEFENTFISGWTQNDNNNTRGNLGFNTTSSPEVDSVQFYCNNTINVSSLYNIFIDNRSNPNNINFRFNFKVNGTSFSQIEFYFGSIETTSNDCITHCQHSMYEISCQ